MVLKGLMQGFLRAPVLAFPALDGKMVCFAAKSHEQSSQKMVLLNTGYFPLMFDIPVCWAVLKQQNCLNNVVTVFCFSIRNFFMCSAYMPTLPQGSHRVLLEKRTLVEKDGRTQVYFT